MPHQCLKCGRVFQEGSSQLLKGCPECGGNRFFFTKKPLNEKERNTKKEEVGKDINSVLMELVQEQGQDKFDKLGKWPNMKPKDVRQVLKKHIEKNDGVPFEKSKDIDTITDDNYRDELIQKIKTEVDNSQNPETIDIEKTGKYKIDLKGLLEEEPIIIQKDGSYVIHLPSIFKMADKEKK